MKLPASLALVVFAAACRNDPPVKHEPPPPAQSEPLPEWSGPPLQVTSRADRGLDLELTAPTAGHAFELRSIDAVGGGVACVLLLHRTPGDAFVAQVLTPLRVRIDADRLGAARRIEIRIATAHGPAEAPKNEKLAFVIVR